MLNKVYRAVKTFFFNIFHSSHFPLNSSIGRNLYYNARPKKGRVTIGTGFACRNGCGIICKGRLVIGEHVFFNQNVFVSCLDQISIGNNTSIANNVVIVDHDHSKTKRGEFDCAPVVIGENVWIGANSVILKGVEIGENSTIAAGSIVTKNVPPNTILIQKRESSVVNKPSSFISNASEIK